MLVVISPAVLAAMGEIDQGRTASARHSYEAVLALLPGLALAALFFAAGVGVLVLLVITAPLAVLVGVRWQFFGQAILLDGAGGGSSALKLSREVVRGAG